ncbi:MAG: hypothetical protein HKM89_01100 [Gemmatimonadales bacterium]|nr:hypothetical protein [Gemmatimonadales bacterium]
MESAGKHRAISTGVLLAFSVVGMVLTRGVPAAVRDLYPTALPPHPYFVPGNAALLYIALPFACVTAILVLLLPGIFLVLAHGRDDRLESVVIKGFGAALVLHFVTTTGAKLLLPGPIGPATFMVLAAGAGLVTWGILAGRLRRFATMRWPLGDATGRRRLAWMMAIPWIAVVLLVPTIFWQDLSADGFEAMEIGRSLSWTVLPRFLTESGLVGLGIGMLPMAYPVHWFIMLFGPIEAATRLPLVLCLPVLFAALLALIEFRSPRRLGRLEDTVVVLALAVFVLTMGYSASYNSYFADLSSPAAFEALTITVMVASAYFLWSEQPWWFVGAAVLSYLARPTGLLFILLFAAGVFFVAPERRRRTVFLVAATVGMWGIVYVAWEILLPSLTDSEVGYTASSIIERFHYLRLDDWHRVLYVVVPGGIVPALVLAAVRWQDRIARSLTFAAVGYFLVFYVPAFTNLHHFVPVMILPIAVFWRIVLRQSGPRWLAGAALVGGAAAFVVSMPRHFEIDRTMRLIGNATAYRIGDYGGPHYGAHRESYDGGKLLQQLFAADWDVADPSAELVGNLQLIYYASQAVEPGSGTNYIVQRQSEPPSPGFSKLGEDETGAIYIRDMDRWHRDRFRPRRTDYRNRLYDIPRTTLFSYWGIPAREYTLNLGALPLLWRVF